MSATDILRAMLDERGVEWKETMNAVGCVFTWWKSSVFSCDVLAMDNDDGTIYLDIPRLTNYTPEQAIAATLGSEREAELQKALNKAAGNWAMADAELRKALDFMRIWISEDAHLGESELGAAFEKAEGLRKLDVIESAIAATLGSGTCHMNFVDEYETASGEEEYLCECSECGYRRWEPAHDLPLFCSKCGAKVVDE